jgi:hypothetical protein
MKKDVWDTYWSDESNHEWWERPAPEVVECNRGTKRFFSNWLVLAEKKDRGSVKR